MSASDQPGFHCDVEELTAGNGQTVSRVVCHGRLVAGNTEALRTTVHPLLARGSRVVIDCADLAFVDSMGLGALVSLKVSSVHKGFNTLEYTDLSPRIKELLRITKLTEYLMRPDTVNYGG